MMFSFLGMGAVALPAVLLQHSADAGVEMPLLDVDVASQRRAEFERDGVVMIKGANQYFLRTRRKSQMSLVRSRKASIGLSQR